MRPFILSSGRCLCHGSHPNAVESLGVFRNNFCIVKNLDFVLKYSVILLSGIDSMSSMQLLYFAGSRNLEGWTDRTYAFV